MDRSKKQVDIQRKGQNYQKSKLALRPFESGRYCSNLVFWVFTYDSGQDYGQYVNSHRPTIAYWNKHRLLSTQKTEMDLKKMTETNSGPYDTQVDDF